MNIKYEIDDILNEEEYKNPYDQILIGLSQNPTISKEKEKLLSHINNLRKQYDDKFGDTSKLPIVPNPNTDTQSHNNTNIMDMIHNPYAQMAALAGVGLAGYGAHKYFKNKKGNN